MTTLVVVVSSAVAAGFQCSAELGVEAYGGDLGGALAP